MNERLSWLPMSDRKGLPMPRVVFRDIAWASGAFFCRMAERCFDKELDADRNDGDVLVISTHWGQPSASTIAHEHRHFQQYYCLGLPQCGVVQPFQMMGDGEEDWRAGIRRFYRAQPWEMDALRYAMRIHRDEKCECEWEALTC